MPEMIMVNELVKVIVPGTRDYKLSGWFWGSCRVSVSGTVSDDVASISQWKTVTDAAYDISGRSFQQVMKPPG